MILEGKDIPVHYYGPSTASDNTFDHLRRLFEISILVRENASGITKTLRAEGIQRERLAADLRHLQEAYRWAAAIFQDAALEIDERLGQ